MRLILILFLFLFVRIFYMILNDGFRILNFYKRRKFPKTEFIIEFILVFITVLLMGITDSTLFSEFVLIIVLFILFSFDYPAITNKSSKIFYLIMVAVSLFVFVVTFGRYYEKVCPLYFKKIYEQVSTGVPVIKNDDDYKYIVAKKPDDGKLLLIAIPLKYPRFIPQLEPRRLYFIYKDRPQKGTFEEKEGYEYIYVYKMIFISYKESKYSVGKLIKLKFNKAKICFW